MSAMTAVWPNHARSEPDGSVVVAIHASVSQVAECGSLGR